MADARPWAYPLGAAAIAAVLAWPAFGGAVFSSRDAVFSAVAMGRVGGAGALGYPLPAIVQADWMFGQALLVWLLERLGLDLMRAYVAVCFVGLALGAAVVARAAARLLGDGPHVLVASAVGGLGVGHLAHAHHANLVFDGVGWAGLLLAVEATLRGDRRLAALGGLFAGASFHFGVYTGLHTAFLAFALAVTRPRESAAPALGFLLGALTFAPVAAIYAHADRVLGAGIPYAEIVGESLDLARWFGGGVARAGEDPASPGWMALGFAAVGVAAMPRGVGHRVALGVLLVSGVLALGPALRWGDAELGPAPYRLLLGVPGLGSLRAPARWLILSWAAVGLFAAAGAQALGARLGRPWAVAAVAVLAALLQGPRPAFGPPVALPAIYDALATAPPGPLAEVFSRQRDGCVGAPSVLAAADHGRPLVGGLFARPYPSLMALNALTRRFPDAAAVEALRAIGARVVLVHGRLRAPMAGCEARDGHVICALLPRAPLPEPGAVGPGAGPTVGLRFAAAIPEEVAVRCGDRLETHLGAAWEGVAGLRAVAGPVGHDVFLDAPCDGPVTVAPAVAFVPLVRAVRAGDDGAVERP